ncbi:hypothetical protein NUW54_g13123 [Trametes sanguinea]|uniref:Uncharacterized protein n=1 Tax=Trametes sanguinea TaxID=158606 RepID=A0ACC1MP17_9APHY|nr:hypothetical protein NUW54_g13123 [Trametes sanguinea]
MPGFSNDIRDIGIGLAASTHSKKANSESSNGGVVALLASVAYKCITTQVITRGNVNLPTPEQVATAPESMVILDDSSLSEDEDGYEPYDDLDPGWRPKGGSTTNSSGKPKDVVKPTQSK